MWARVGFGPWSEQQLSALTIQRLPGTVLEWNRNRPFAGRVTDERDGTCVESACRARSHRKTKKRKGRKGRKHGAAVDESLITPSNHLD